MRTKRTSSGLKILNATNRQAELAIREGMEAGGEIMGLLTPYDTGLLESNNKIEIDGMAGKMENDTPYGPFVEFGTYKMDAQPFFRPARDAAWQKIKSLMRIRS